MDKILTIFKKHHVALLLALLAALIVASPQVIFRIDHKDDGVYQGIELMPDSFWSPRVREVQDGHPNFGSMYWKEGKDGPYLFQPLGSMVVAYMGELFSLDINNTLLLSRFVLTFAVFILIYSFVLLLSRERFAALSSAAVIILAYEILDPHGLISFLKGYSPSDFLIYSQPVIPATIHLFLFAFLIVFWLFYKKQDWRLGVLASILLGLQFYNYFYLWTYLYAFGGLLGLFLLFRKEWKEALGVALVYLGAVVVAIPYLYNLYQVTTHPLYEDVSERIGIILTHAPLWIGIVVLFSLFIFFLFYPRENKKQYLFSLALLLVPFITLNQQILTGKIMQEGHYHYYLHKPVVIVLAFIAIFAFFTKKQLFIYKKALVVLAILGSIFIGLFVQYESYVRGTVHGGSIAIERQRYGPIMEWLNDNAEKEAVVFANDEISHLVTIYTPLNVFYHRAAPYSSLVATEERLLDMIFAFYRLRDVTFDEAQTVFFNERAQISLDLHHLEYKYQLGAVEAIPDERINEVLNYYMKTFSDSTDEYLKNIWEKYEVEYIVWDMKENPDWQVDKYLSGIVVAEYGDLVIYQLSGAGTVQAD